MTSRVEVASLAIPQSTAETPASVYDRDVQYRLVDIFAASGLWTNRNNAALFASSGSFAGDSGGGCYR